MNPCVSCARPSDAFLCSRQDRDDPGCTQKLEQAIAEMPSYLHELEVAATRQAKVYRRTGTGDTSDDESWAAEERLIPAYLRSRHPATAMRSGSDPANLAAADLRTATVDELLRLASQLGADQVSPSAVVGWLLAHLDDIRVSVDAGEVFDRITYRRRQIERAVDRAPSRVYAGPCHAWITGVVEETRDGTIYRSNHTARCELHLYAWPGADEIICDGWTPRSSLGKGCGTVHTPDDRDEWLIASIGDALLPLAEWQSTLPRMLPNLRWPTRKTWWVWGNVLENRGREDAPLYRGSDVITKAIKEQERILANSNKRKTTRRTA